MNFNFLIEIINQNSQRDYIVAFGVLLLSLIVLKLFKSYFIHLAKRLTKKTKTDIDDYIVEFIEQIRWPVYIFIALAISIRTIILPNIVTEVIDLILILLIIYYFVRGLSKVVDYIIKRRVDKMDKAERDHDSVILKMMGYFVKAFFWIVALLLVLSNFGINITSLIAGLGVGGIAIAFALQNILSDLFSAFTIYLDKPFKVGDYIVLGTDSGTVKNIGLKSTRIQTLQGEELIVSNHELTNTRINNFKKMKKRRILFGFGVEYGTSSQKLKKINEIITKIFDQVKIAELDRVHFKDFGDFSLNYEIVYFLNSKEYDVFMDTQEQINLAIKDKFEKEGIEMAFPTQVIHVKK